MNVHEIHEKLTELMQKSRDDHTRAFRDADFYLGQRERTQEILNLFGDFNTSEVNSSGHKVAEGANAGPNSTDIAQETKLPGSQKAYLWLLRRMIRGNDNLSARGLNFSFDDVYKTYADSRDEREKWQVSRQMSSLVEQGFLVKEDERYRLGNKNFEEFLNEVDEEMSERYPMQLIDDEIPF